MLSTRPVSSRSAFEWVPANNAYGTLYLSPQLKPDTHIYSQHLEIPELWGKGEESKTHLFDHVLLLFTRLSIPFPEMPGFSRIAFKTSL